MVVVVVFLWLHVHADGGRLMMLLLLIVKVGADDVSGQTGTTAALGVGKL